MTQRKSKDSITCGGCGREFGIIQASHIINCDPLKEMGIITRADYKNRFGQTLSKSVLQKATDRIVSINNSISPEERSVKAKIAQKIAIKKHPDLPSRAGKAGIRAIHKIKGRPNKLEQFFWELIGRNLISFTVSKSFLPESARDCPFIPDFYVNSDSSKVIDVFGNNWHAEDPSKRISDLAEYGLETLVIWESEIKKDPTEVKNRVLLFISGNPHERGTPASNSLQDEDIVRSRMETYGLTIKSVRGLQ